MLKKKALRRRAAAAAAGQAASSGFGAFAARHFTPGTAGGWSRGPRREPVLASTPKADTQAAVSLWRCVLRYMGDVMDGRSDLPYTSHQPALGPVMTRLLRRLGRAPGTADVSVAHPLDGFTDDQPPARDGGGDMTSQGGGRGLRKLTASLRLKLDKDTRRTVFHDLPMEDTLMTSLEQIQFIIGYGILQLSLRDEIYCLLCKQLTDNPFDESRRRGWALLELTASCFAPSDKLLQPVLDFVDTRPSHAAHIRQKIQTTLTSGPRHQPPSSMEVQSVLTRSPLLLTVTSMDGAAHTLPAEPSVSAAALRDAVCQHAGITDTFGWAIYIAMYNKVASLGHGENYVLDAVSQCEQIYRERQKDGPVPCRLYLRKEVLAPWPEEEENSAATDLVYAQVCRGLLLHEYVCQSDLDLAVLAAEQYYVEFGVGAAGPVGEADVAPLLPAYVPASERSDTDRVSFWCRSIATAHRQLFGGTADRPTQAQVKQDVVSFARRTWPRQLSAVYEARAEAMAGDTVGPGPGSGRRRVAISSEGVTVSSGGQQRHVTWAEIAAVTTDVGFARQKRSTSDSGGEQSHDPAPPSTSAGGFTNGHGSGTVTFLLYGGGKAGAPATVRLQTSEAGEVAGLVASGLSGLTRRSRWAVALQDSTSAESLQYRHGDLLHLEAPVSTGNVTATARRAGPGRAGGEEAGAGVERDTGAGDSGTVLVSNIHVLPCVDKPAPAVLRLFQKQKGLSAVAQGPPTEEDPPTHPLDSPPTTPPTVSRTKTFPSHRHQGLRKALASLAVDTAQVEESGKSKDHVNEKVNLNQSTEELDAAVRFINGSIQQIDKGATADDTIDQLKERFNIEDSTELVDGRVKSRDSTELVNENIKPEGSGEVVEGEGHLDDEDDQTVHSGDFG